MLTEEEKNKLRVSLTAAIKDWWDDKIPELDVNQPYAGNNLFPIMAEASLSVIFGMSDMEEYLKKEFELDF